MFLYREVMMMMMMMMMMTMSVTFTCRRTVYMYILSCVPLESCV